MSAAVRRAGLVVHAGRPSAIATARDLAAWLREHGVATRALEGEFDGADEGASTERFADALDLVVSVGGDGTLLRAARLAASGRVPLLGVKVGRLGFLTEVEPDDAPAMLADVLAGRFRVDERPALSAGVLEGPGATAQWALNEVIVEKSARHRLITLAASIGEEYVTTFSADGVIVATPTGSTAYSFSARGPVVAPNVDCLILTPVSPHMLFDRAIVFSPAEHVTLEVVGDEGGWLSADGQPGVELPVGARVRIGRASTPARLVRRAGGPRFFELLREKFSLPEVIHGVTGDRRARPGDVAAGYRDGSTAETERR